MKYILSPWKTSWAPPLGFYHSSRHNTDTVFQQIGLNISVDNKFTIVLFLVRVVVITPGQERTSWSQSGMHFLAFIYLNQTDYKFVWPQKAPFGA